VPPIKPRVPLIAVQKIPGGFRVPRNPASAERPKRVSIRVAYEVRRGNPFKKYEPFDFKLDESPIVVTPVGADCDCKDNTIQIRPIDNQYLVEVTGFDPHRDLTVKADAEVDHAEEV
jgi:hypothetical protein